MAKPQVGYQPRTTPAERRADIDNRRLVADLRQLIAQMQTTLNDHEARIAALEP